MHSAAFFLLLSCIWFSAVLLPYIVAFILQIFDEVLYGHISGHVRGFVRSAFDS